MTNSELYVEDLYYTYTGHCLNKDNCFERRFSAIDIRAAYQEGQSDIGLKVIDKIFDLNKKYLINCRLNNEFPNNTNRNAYIMQHLYE